MVPQIAEKIAITKSTEARVIGIFNLPRNIIKKSTATILEPNERMNLFKLEKVFLFGKVAINKKYPGTKSTTVIAI